MTRKQLSVYQDIINQAIPVLEIVAALKNPRMQKPETTVYYSNNNYLTVGHMIQAAAVLEKIKELNETEQE